MSFVYNNATLNGAKVNRGDLPGGEDPNKWIQADEDWNPTIGAIYDLRTAFLDNLFLGIGRQSGVPTPPADAALDFIWASSAGDLYWHVNGVGDKKLNDQSGGGGGTLATSYAAGTTATDQTMLIQSGFGGPVVVKANGAATGSLFGVKDSIGTVLVNFADNDTQRILSKNAGGAQFVANSSNLVDGCFWAFGDSGNGYNVAQWTHNTTSLPNPHTTFGATMRFGDNGSSGTIITGTGLYLISGQGNASYSTGTVVDTNVAWTDPGARLLSLRTQTNEWWGIDGTGLVSQQVSASTNAYQLFDTGTTNMVGAIGRNNEWIGDGMSLISGPDFAIIINVGPASAGNNGQYLRMYAGDAGAGSGQPGGAVQVTAGQGDGSGGLGTITFTGSVVQVAGIFDVSNQAVFGSDSAPPFFNGAVHYDGTHLQYSDDGATWVSFASGGSGTVTSVATDATLTGGPIITTGTLGIALGHANTWTSTQTFPSPVLNGVTSSGSTAIDFSGNSGTWKPPTGGINANLVTASSLSSFVIGNNATIDLIDVGAIQFMYGATPYFDLSWQSTLYFKTRGDLVGSLGLSGNRWTETWSRAFAGVHQDVTSSGAVAINTQLGETYVLTSNNNVSSLTLAAGKPSQLFTMELVQGNAAHTWPSTITNARMVNGPFAKSLTLNAVDYYTFRYNATNATWDEVARSALGPNNWVLETVTGPPTMSTSNWIMQPTLAAAGVGLISASGKATGGWVIADDANGTSIGFAGGYLLVYDSFASLAIDNQSTTSHGLLDMIGKNSQTLGSGIHMSMDNGAHYANYGLVLGNAAVLCNTLDRLVDTGGVTANTLVVASANNKVQKAGATANLSTIVGVAASTVASGSTAPIAYSGDIFIKYDGTVNVGDIVVSSGTTAGSIITNNSPTLGIIVGRAMEGGGTTIVGQVRVFLMLS